MKPKEIIELEKELGVVLEENTTDNNFLQHHNLNTYKTNDKNDVIALYTHIINSKRKIIKDLSFLRNFPTLKYLRCRMIDLETIEHLEYVPNLEMLVLINCEIENISVLSKLTNLQRLILDDNKIKNIAPISNLAKLIQLTLSNNKIKSIEPLKDLLNLGYLDLSSNNIDDISSLQKSKNLYTVILYNNLITNIDVLLNSKNSLQNLEIGSNPIKDYTILGNLSKLNSLEISSAKIDNYSFLYILKNLTSLSLSNNSIDNIEFLEPLKQLEWLYLKENNIEKIDTLKSFKNLKLIAIQNNPITIFPKWLLNFELEIHWKQYNIFITNDGLFSESGIYLYENPITNLTTISFNKEENYNYFSDIKNYFTELEKGFIINETVKLIIVGNGRVGKTSMFKKLKGLPFDENESYTHGINIGIVEKENLPEAKTEKLKLNVWDFGGQEIFYATHQFFMRDDALYILAWTDEKNILLHREKDADILPNNEPEKWQSCEYWLDTIRRYAKNSPILMTQTHTDCTKTAINETLLKKDYNVTEFLNFSASKSYGLEEFKNAITQNLNSLTMYGEKFPKTYENVILAIENRKNENVISYSEFVNTICRNANISEGGENSLLSYLDKTGLVVHYAQHEKLQDKIYINPEWLTKQVYSLINNKLQKTEGKISLDYLKENLPNYEKFELIELFKKFELLFEVQDKNETFWISPQYLPENLENNKSFQKQFDKSSVKLVFRFATFMPDNVMINFLSRYGSFAKDEYWKNGIYFTKNDSDCIVIRENSTDLYVYTDKNQDNNKLLQEVCNAFVEFGKNAKTEISVNQKDFVVYSECKDNFERKAKEIKSLQGEILKMKDFEFLFGDNNSFVKEKYMANKLLKQTIQEDEANELLELVREILVVVKQIHNSNKNWLALFYDDEKNREIVKKEMNKLHKLTNYDVKFGNWEGRLVSYKDSMQNGFVADISRILRILQGMFYEYKKINTGERIITKEDVIIFLDTDIIGKYLTQFGKILYELGCIEGVLENRGTTKKISKIEQQMQTPINIFISYSSADRKLREIIEKELKVHLKSSKYRYQEIWTDKEIAIGDDWNTEIQDALKISDIGILLVSPKFLGSQYCSEDELKIMLDKRQNEGYLIVPILIRECNFSNNAKLKAMQFFKTYQSEYEITDLLERDKFMPFDKLVSIKDVDERDRLLNTYFVKLVKELDFALDKKFAK
jgi:internalin A